MKTRKTILLLIAVLLITFIAYGCFKEKQKKVSKKPVTTQSSSIAKQKSDQEENGYLGRQQTLNKVEGLNGVTVKRDDALHRKENKIRGLEGLKVGN